MHASHSKAEHKQRLRARSLVVLDLGMASMVGMARAQQPITPPLEAIYWLAGERSFDDRAGFHNGTGSGASFIAAGRSGFTDADIPRWLRKRALSRAQCDLVVRGRGFRRLQRDVLLV